MKFLSKLFRKGHTVDEILDPRQRVYIRGIWFTIRKINPIDHLHGAKVLTESYKVSTLEDRKSLANQPEPNLEKIKQHYRDVFTQCVLDPVFVRKEADAGEGKTWVDRLFLDWEIAQELYEAIMVFTYGKKKVKKMLDLYS